MASYDLRHRTLAVRFWQDAGPAPSDPQSPKCSLEPKLFESRMENQKAISIGTKPGLTLKSHLKNELYAAAKFDADDHDGHSLRGSRV